MARRKRPAMDLCCDRGSRVLIWRRRGGYTIEVDGTKAAVRGEEL